MLIPSDRHRRRDLEMWAALEEADRQHYPQIEAKVAKATEDIAAFVARGPCYASVSWGKDSVVLAHLVAVHRLPLVWVKQVPIYNPDCEAVRDVFLSRHDSPYDEIVVQLRRGVLTWHATGSIEAGFAEATKRYGPRYLSGIRASESGGRKLRMMTHGVATENTCAPLGWWTEQDVFAYLAAHDLPVHPVYAMLGGGRWPRDRIRTCRLDGKSGGGLGRAEWEREYYGDVLRRMEADTWMRH